jgi:hypothetical protein
MGEAAEALTCPKCNRPRLGEASCPGCGLAAIKMEEFARRREATAPDAVRAAWDALEPPTRADRERAPESPWNDAARHDELLRLVHVYDCYAWAAGRYRDVHRLRPDDKMASRMVERIRKAAEATMMASASVRAETGPKPYRATVAVLAMLIVALIAMLLYAILFRKSPDAPSAEQPAPSLQQRQQPHPFPQQRAR